MATNKHVGSYELGTASHVPAVVAGAGSCTASGEILLHEVNRCMSGAWDMNPLGSQPCTTWLLLIDVVM